MNRMKLVLNTYTSRTKAIPICKYCLHDVDGNLKCNWLCKVRLNNKWILPRSIYPECVISDLLLDNLASFAQPTQIRSKEQIRYPESERLNVLHASILQVYVGTRIMQISFPAFASLNSQCRISDHSSSIPPSALNLISQSIFLSFS